MWSLPPASLWIITLSLSSDHPLKWTGEHFQDLVTRKVFIRAREVFLSNVQAGDTGGHGLLGSADPGSAVWVWWLATLWVKNQSLIFYILPFFPPWKSWFASIRTAKSLKRQPEFQSGVFSKRGRILHWSVKPFLLFFQVTLRWWRSPEERWRWSRARSRCCRPGTAPVLTSPKTPSPGSSL